MPNELSNVCIPFQPLRTGNVRIESVYHKKARLQVAVLLHIPHCAIKRKSADASGVQMNIIMAETELL